MKKKIYLARDNKTDRAFEEKGKRLIEISGEKFYELVTALSGRKRYFIRLTDDIDFECAEIFAEVFASLDQDEKELIYLLYLCEEPLTEKQAAAALHITQQAVNKRKKKF